MVPRWSVVLAVLALLVVGTVSGCSGSDEPTAKPSPSGPTPIGKLDTGAIRIARAPFCDLVPATAVRHALGAEPQGDESWGNGDPVGGDAGSGDVGHEIGCAWTRTDGSAARAWVFARPVTADLAGAVVTAAASRRNCTADRTAVFGSPAMLQHCTLGSGLVRDRRAGLFGDTWLTCEVTSPATTGTATPAPTSAPVQRAKLDAWCATIVSALDTTS